MAPLPSTLDEEATALIDNLDRRKKDLLDFQIPRLRDFKGPLVTQQQYAAELHDDVDTFARLLETLDVSVDDQKGERNRRELRRIVDEYQETLTILRKETRSAVLTSKRAIDANRQSNREELLRSSAVREKQNLNEKVAEDALMKTSNDVTVALQRTIGLMQGELERSVLSTQLLDASTASLKSASSTHDVLDSLMVTSKHLITALEKSDWLDRLLILAGLMFFILVILFILKQRLVDRSIRIAFWWTRFIPSSSDKAMDAMEKGAIAVSATLSSVVAGVSTAAVSATASLASVTPSPLRGEAGPRKSLAQPDAPTSSSRDKLVSDHTTLGDPPETLLATMGTPTAIPLGHDEL
ncbi:unnamed protein product [Somion occarium]|uniref:Sec20 C-terminal domain-containing protein n=1 Tax=Somion occarium TaxID=3059160 RepID=A0ABP1CUZ4_9APHY